MSIRAAGLQSARRASVVCRLYKGMVGATGIEPVTPPCQGGALPLSYAPIRRNSRVSMGLRDGAQARVFHTGIASNLLGRRSGGRKQGA